MRVLHALDSVNLNIKLGRWHQCPRCARGVDKMVWGVSRSGEFHVIHRRALTSSGIVEDAAIPMPPSA